MVRAVWKDVEGRLTESIVIGDCHVASLLAMT